MAIQTRTVLKTYFNTGDRPIEENFVELIDSNLNLKDGGTLTGVLSSSLDSGFAIIAHSASFNHLDVKGSITASNVHIDAETLFIGGTSFSKSNLDDLKSGKSIAAAETVDGVSIKKSSAGTDGTTFLRMSQAGKAWHYVGNKPILKLAYAGTPGVGIINVGVDMGTGFVSLDSATKLSAGAGNPNTITTTFTIPDNMNYQLIGPEVSVNSTISVGEGSLLYITQP